MEGGNGGDEGIGGAEVGMEMVGKREREEEQ